MSCTVDLILIPIDKYKVHVIIKAYGNKQFNTFVAIY